MNIKDKIPGYNTLVLPYHYLQSLAATTKAGFPGKRLRIIGVTGTNGKTTTSFMIWQMLNHAGYKTGLMTTVAWGVDKLEKQVEHMTTVKPSTLNHRIKTIANSGAEFLVLEVTSHALAQYRTLGLTFEIAVMTNVTHEHLDYHKTFDNYLNAKCKLFKQAKYGVVNADDPSAAHFIQALKSSNYTTYGIKSGLIQAKKIKLSAAGIDYSYCDVKNSKDTFPIHTKIPGEFNVYNSLAAACVGKKLGLNNKQISEGLYSLAEVEGRMNRLDYGQEFDCIVDFAHTPDAFEKVFTSISKPKGRIISLFGGAGRRDESTRKTRGQIAGKYSDICIITEDDSRDEDPNTIIADFAEGCKKAGMKDDQIIKITDRKKAIEHAIKIAKPKDIVLILGKGHEKTIIRADGPHPFEDLKVTANAIKRRSSK